MYSNETIVTVHPFTRQSEGEDVVIGSLETGIFLALPPEAVEILDLLARGKSVGEVADLYFQKTGETPDLEDLLSHLETKGLVEPEVAGIAGARQSSRPVHETKFHFSRFPKSLARRLFSYPVLACETALAGFALAAVLIYHALMPVPADLVFYHRRALSWTFLMIFTYGGIFLHELAHLIAARSVGVNSRMSISHRLWYLVAETDLTGLWSVPRNQRYLPMLAGMIVDITALSLIVLTLLCQLRHLVVLSPLTVHLLRAMAFTNLMRLLWEFFLFMRTDLYFVAATFLNCKNLLSDTRVFLHNQLSLLTSLVSPVSQPDIPRTERRAIRIYAAIFLAGRMWAFATLFWVTIPVCVGYWGSLIPALREGYSANPSDFLDSLAAAIYFLVPTVAGFVYWLAALMRHKGVQNGSPQYAAS